MYNLWNYGSTQKIMQALRKENKNGYAILDANFYTLNEETEPIRVGIGLYNLDGNLLEYKEYVTHCVLRETATSYGRESAKITEEELLNAPYIETVLDDMFLLYPKYNIDLNHTLVYGNRVRLALLSACELRNLTDEKYEVYLNNILNLQIIYKRILHRQKYPAFNILARGYGIKERQDFDLRQSVFCINELFVISTTKNYDSKLAIDEDSLQEIEDRIMKNIELRNRYIKRIRGVKRILIRYLSGEFSDINSYSREICRNLREKNIYFDGKNIDRFDEHYTYIMNLLRERNLPVFLGFLVFPFGSKMQQDYINTCNKYINYLFTEIQKDIQFLKSIKRDIELGDLNVNIDSARLDELFSAVEDTITFEVPNIKKIMSTMNTTDIEHIGVSDELLKYLKNLR